MNNLTANAVMSRLFHRVKGSTSSVDSSMDEGGGKDVKEKKLPPVGERVLLRCGGFQCLGFLDREGRWKNVFHGTEMKDVVSWNPL